MLALCPTPREAVASQIRCPDARSSLRLHGPGDAGRGEVERFIAVVYRERHGADVRHFAHTLVSLRDGAGELVAAAGYRAADQAPLFLERYLGAPVETRLADTAGLAPARSRIVEVGHLAASRAGEGRRLVLLLGPHLATLGFQWLGIAPLALGVADPTVLGAEAVHWGSYYDHRPVVLAGQIDLALKALARRGALA